MGESDLFYIIRFFVSSAISLLLALIVLCIRIPKGKEYRKPRAAKYMVFVSLLMLGLPLTLISVIRVTPSNICYYYLSDSIAYMMLAAAPALLYSMDGGRRIAGFSVSACLSVVLLECHFIFSFMYAESGFRFLSVLFFVLSSLSLVYLSVAYACVRKGAAHAGVVPDMFFCVILLTAVCYQLLLPLFPGLDNYTTYLVMKVLFIVVETLFVIWFFEYSSRLRAAVAVVNDGVTDESAGKVPSQEKTISDDAAAALEQRLDKWVAEKHFLEQDEGIDLVAAQLGTDLKTLRTYFRTRMPSDFRTWRISLRIDFAKEKLREDPGISVNRLSEMSGFATRSNFYHYFKKITGMTPVEYKERLTDAAGNPNS